MKIITVVYLKKLEIILSRNQIFYRLARVAELVDALSWGGSENIFVWVQIPSLAPVWRFIKGMKVFIILYRFNKDFKLFVNMFNVSKQLFLFCSIKIFNKLIFFFSRKLRNFYTTNQLIENLNFCDVMPATVSRW